MKHNFMNKENGKVASVLVMYLDDEGHMQTDFYNKVEDLMDDYAAHKPAKPEPLIKDEKIRKAVRAWAEANEYYTVLYNKDEDCLHSPYGSDDSDTSVCISFDDVYAFDKLEHRKTYTIAELCGEEEE